jgi:hypothetical protein
VIRYVCPENVIQCQVGKKNSYSEKC